MDIEINEVQEIIKNLEDSGELSIKEEKYLKVARLCVQLAAENLQIKAMNDCLSEELRGYESDGAFEGPKMHLLWWQVETPATDRIVAGIKADGVEEFSADLGAVYQQLRQVSTQAKTVKSVIFRAAAFSAALREGADK